VVGFALGWEGQAHGTLWITGDTVLYDGVRQVADRLQVDTALLHLGCVRFPITGPVRYSMTAREAVELCQLVRPRTVIPVHYEGWTHFRQGRGAIKQQVEQAPADIGRRLQWCPSAPASASPGEHTSFRPGGPMSERLTSPLTVGVELRKRLSAQRWAATYSHGGGQAVTAVVSPHRVRGEILDICASGSIRGVGGQVAMRHRRWLHGRSTVPVTSTRSA
jgi:hypothetical protein